MIFICFDLFWSDSNLKIFNTDSNLSNFNKCIIKDCKFTNCEINYNTFLDCDIQNTNFQQSVLYQEYNSKYNSKLYDNINEQINQKITNKKFDLDLFKLILLIYVMLSWVTVVKSLVLFS